MSSAARTPTIRSVCGCRQCATGEEAYSIAILLAEAATKQGAAAPKSKFFATDIDEQAIAMARAARYRKLLLAEMSDGRRERWFVKEDDHYYPSRASGKHASSRRTVSSRTRPSRSWT